MFRLHFPRATHPLPQRLVFRDLDSKPDFTTHLSTTEDVAHIILIYIYSLLLLYSTSIDGMGVLGKDLRVSCHKE